MMIPRCRIGPYFARRVPRRHHADFAIKFQRLLDNAGPPAQLPPHHSKAKSFRRTIRTDARLPASVVASAPDFHEHITAKHPYCFLQLSFALHNGERSHRKPVLR